MFLAIPFIDDFLKESKHVVRNHLYDTVDRLHFYVTAVALVFFSLLIGAKQHFGNPIDCMLAKEIDDVDSWKNYYHSFCLMYGTYRYSMNNGSTTFYRDREDMSVRYYQWVPFFFAFQVFCFVLPHWIWTWMQKLLYLDMALMVKHTDELLNQKNPEDYNKSLDCIVSYAYDHFKYRRLHRIGYMSWVFHHPSLGCFLYIFTKILFVGNAYFQFYLVNKFLGINDYMWGYKMAEYMWGDRNEQHARDLIYNVNMPTSPTNNFPYFPILVSCDFKHSPSVAVFMPQNTTAQCIIPLNILNEKLFVALWFWLLFLIAISLINLIFWIMTLWSRRQGESAIFHLLRNEQDLKDTSTSAFSRIIRNKSTPDHRYDFVHKFLAADGLLMIHFMTSKAGALKTGEVVNGIFKRYVKDFPKPQMLMKLKNKGEKTDYSEVNFGVDEEDEAYDHKMLKKKLPV